MAGQIPLTIAKIKERNRFSQLIILVSFLITFLFVRTWTFLQYIGALPNQNGDLHIHHLVPGIILILISGYVAISFWNDTKLRWYFSALFGIGAALTIDEFALLVYLQDVYWTPQGWRSIDAVIITTALLAIAYLISEAHDHHFLKKIFDH